MEGNIVTRSDARWTALRLRFAAALLVAGFTALGLHGACAPAAKASVSAAATATDSTDATSSPTDTGSPWD